MTPFLGSIFPIAFNFPPKGYALCNGQFLPINQNQALFSLLGTTYGGNGQTTFALPDLRGRTGISSGQGPGLQNYQLGQASGIETVTLNINQMPLHNHTMFGTTAAASTPTANGNVLGQFGAYASSPPDPAAGSMSAATISTVGGSQPHENREPFLVINWIIALQGIFPSQN
jgi:microcystin-dependent protein